MAIALLSANTITILLGLDVFIRTGTAPSVVAANAVLTVAVLLHHRRSRLVRAWGGACVLAAAAMTFASTAMT